jgi:hypothetical protein
MADPISDLRSAGFDDKEIAGWTAEKRKSLTEAGL